MGSCIEVSLVKNKEQNVSLLRGRCLSMILERDEYMFLSDELLGRIHSRAADYDKRNVFPKEDYEDLREAGYFKAFVPKEYGGYGLSFKEMTHEQTRLAKAAPATALGINMHQIIVGMAQYIVRHGNEKGEQILRDAVNGELLAFGISEPANDRVLFGSIIDADPQEDGGYKFTGPKVFISMIGEATRFVTYGQDENKGDPLSVFAYLKKDKETLNIHPEWDVLGMRGTQSYNMKLEGAYAPESQILEKVQPSDIYATTIFGIFAYFEIFLGATYYGIGQRALELGIETVKNRKSVSNAATYDQDKNIRWRIAEAALALDGIRDNLDVLADDVENDVDHGEYWYPRLSAVKNKAVEASKKAVEEVVRASGGQSYSNKNEISRLLRDVYAGLFQPSDQKSLHDSWANVLLGPIKD